MAVMEADIAALKAEGVAGMVFGCLTPDGRPHQAQCRRLIELVCAAACLAGRERRKKKEGSSEEKETTGR